MLQAVLFSIWQSTFGAVQTLLGLFLFLAAKKRDCFRYRGAVVTVWNRPDSVSLGLFLFVADLRSADASDAGNAAFERLLRHEYGHAVQSLLLGPLYLPVIGVPSLLWGTLPFLREKRKAENISYYSFYTERWAERLGNRAIKARG